MSYPRLEIHLDAIRENARRLLSACRAILSVGRADIEPECLEPMEPGIAVLDASSDHLLLDLGGCERELRPGDVIEFKVGYAGVLRACTSPRVEKACV